METYEASPDVEYAEPDYILKPSQTISANDSYYSSLYGLNNSGQNGGTADADVDAPEAWNTTTGDTGTIVAVIDEGVDTNHPDLRNNIWSNPGESGTDSTGRDKANNGVDDDKNNYVDDVNGWDLYNDDPVRSTIGAMETRMAPTSPVLSPPRATTASASSA